jgi:hypothetical protein
MQKFTMPNGGIVTINGDTLQDKIDTLSMLGVDYTPTAAEIAADADEKSSLQSMKAEYLQTLEQLQTIATAGTMTNAQAAAAIKFHARVLRMVLRLLARSIQ